MEQVSQVAKRLLRFFYIADPKETSFQHEDQVPNYLVEVSLIEIVNLSCQVRNCQQRRRLAIDCRARLACTTIL